MSMTEGQKAASDRRSGQPAEDLLSFDLSELAVDQDVDLRFVNGFLHGIAFLAVMEVLILGLFLWVW